MKRTHEYGRECIQNRFCWKIFIYTMHDTRVWVVDMPYFVYFEVTSIIIMWNDFQLNITCAPFNVDTSTCTHTVCCVFIAGAFMSYRLYLWNKFSSILYTCVMKYASKMGPMKTPNHWLWYIVFNGSSKKYIDNERNGGS